MDSKKELILLKEFPLLYSTMYTAKPGVPFHCIQAFGIECGNGWFNLLYETSKKLEVMIRELPKERQQYCHVNQVKEKYGGLIISVAGETNEMDNLTLEAEKKSYETCEDCGNPGRCNKDGWKYTRCSDCRGYELKDEDVMTIIWYD